MTWAASYWGFDKQNGNVSQEMENKLYRLSINSHTQWESMYITKK